MWSIEIAKSLVKKGNKSNDQLAKRLADYLGYALNTIDYYEKLLDKRRKEIERLCHKEGKLE